MVGTAFFLFCFLCCCLLFVLYIYVCNLVTVLSAIKCYASIWKLFNMTLSHTGDPIASTSPATYFRWQLKLTTNNKDYKRKRADSRQSKQKAGKSSISSGNKYKLHQHLQLQDSPKDNENENLNCNGNGYGNGYWDTHYFLPL